MPRWNVRVQAQGRLSSSKKEGKGGNCENTPGRKVPSVLPVELPMCSRQASFVWSSKRLEQLFVLVFFKSLAVKRGREQKQPDQPLESSLFHAIPLAYMLLERLLPLLWDRCFCHEYFKAQSTVWTRDNLCPCRVFRVMYTQFSESTRYVIQREGKCRSQSSVCRIRQSFIRASVIFPNQLGPRWFGKSNCSIMKHACTCLFKLTLKLLNGYQSIFNGYFFGSFD